MNNDLCPLPLAYACCFLNWAVPRTFRHPFPWLVGTISHKPFDQFLVLGSLLFGASRLPSKQVQVPGPAEDPRRRPGEDRRANRSTAGDSGENTATGDIDQARGRRWHSGMARMAVMRHRHARPQASKISDLVRSCKVSCKVFKVLRRG